MLPRSSTTKNMVLAITSAELNSGQLFLFLGLLRAGVGPRTGTCLAAVKQWLRTMPGPAVMGRRTGDHTPGPGTCVGCQVHPCLVFPSEAPGASPVLQPQGQGSTSGHFCGCCTLLGPTAHTEPPGSEYCYPEGCFREDTVTCLVALTQKG